MEKFKEILSQRRIWAVIISALTFTLPFIGFGFSGDVNILLDLLMNTLGALKAVIESVGALIVAALALWSYLKPKITAKK